MHRWRLLSLLLIAPFLFAGCGEALEMELDPDAVVDGAIPAPPNVDGPPRSAETSESGLAWVVLQEGEGERTPGPNDGVRVHYSGWQTDGTMFDSSVSRGSPLEFGVTQVIPGWVEGLQLMTEGEQRRFWIPADLAYGDPAAPGRPSGMLVFDVYLLEILGGGE
jgi:hypothetical protein